MKKSRQEDKIDFVVTWVDGSDPEWFKEKQKYLNKQPQEISKWASSSMRFRDWGTLKYWFRAIEKYAPWVNKVYFVTCGQKPEWLNEECEKLVVIKHEDFMLPAYLPTFNSNAIELNLFRIDELADAFVYFNDDMFLNAPVRPNIFFKKGKPCLVSGFDVARTDYGITNSDINNAKIYNKYFSKKAVIAKHWRKILSIKNGKFLIKTICLAPWRDITGIAENHNPSPYRKSMFRKIWDLEKEELDKTSRNKFRTQDDVNHWLVKGWHILSGDYYPQKQKISKSYTKPIDKEILADIIHEKHKLICINDFDCSEEEFLRNKEALLEVFEKKYSKKSAYEK